MRFSKGKYSYSVIFDNRAEKDRYKYELIQCFKAYQKKLNIETSNLLALPKENGNIKKAIGEIISLYCQKIIIQKMVDAMLSNKYEFDFVFIAERDQGLRGKEPCDEILQAPAQITAEISEMIRRCNLTSGTGGKTASHSMN